MERKANHEGTFVKTKPTRYLLIPSTIWGTSQSSTGDLSISRLCPMGRSVREPLDMPEAL